MQIYDDRLVSETRVTVFNFLSQNFYNSFFFSQTFQFPENM